MTTTDPRRLVPRTDAVLADARLTAAADRLGARIVRTAVTDAQDRARRGDIPPSAVADSAAAALPALATSLIPVLNATGVVLHTNLGRAALSPAALEAVTAAAGYVNVEFELAVGQRAGRGTATLQALRAAVPGAEQALVVNNGGAALVLATTALGGGREVIISRGEMVEIGAGFRLADLIQSTGVRIREVGSTNRTTYADYADAVGPDTAAVVKIHPSNFRVDGFTSSVAVRELASLPVPVIVDVGSGLLTADPLLPDEPDVADAIAAGAAAVTCSGDKLLGGPQAGLILGRADVVERMRRHPLARALRVDKLTLAALEATLLGPATPTHRYLHADPTILRARCERLAAATKGEVVPSAGAVGGGGAPGVPLPGWAVAFSPALARPLRTGRPPIVGRVEKDRLLIDLRCVPPDADSVVADAILTASALLAAQGD
jgi:L-seryl-tRNA(Ser) seleniumtransferase